MLKGYISNVASTYVAHVTMFVRSLRLYVEWSQQSSPRVPLQCCATVPRVRFNNSIWPRLLIDDSCDCCWWTVATSNANVHRSQQTASRQGCVMASVTRWLAAFCTGMQTTNVQTRPSRTVAAWAGDVTDWKQKQWLEPRLKPRARVVPSCLTLCHTPKCHIGTAGCLFLLACRRPSCCFARPRRAAAVAPTLTTCQSGDRWFVMQYKW